MTKTLYYAVSKGGQGRIFTSLPIRSEHWGMWLGEGIGAISTVFMIFESEGLEVPDITWKDEPVEVELSINFK